MIDLAYAMGGQGAGAEGAAGGFGAFIPLILMFVIFYFLLIRPQQKKAKEHRKMVEGLRKGDRIQTTGGLYGTITNLDENVVTLEIADKVRIKLARGNVAGLLNQSATQPESKPKAEDNG